MRLVTPLLLVGVCSTPCSAQIPQAVAKLANVKNLGIGSAFTGFLTALKGIHEEIQSREEERQGVKESLRAKASETAKFVVWYHLDDGERKKGETDEEDFKKMLKKGKERMKAKTKRSPWNPLNWLSSRPSSKLAGVYLQEEIAKRMKDIGITMNLEEETNGSKWPTIFAGGKGENAKDGEEEAKTTSKKLKRLLGGVVAAVSGVLLFK